MDELKKHASAAAEFLKGLANADRLLILCLLAEGEKSVTELVSLTGIAQTSVSQHLAKLKKENIVSFRRDHRILYYMIAHEAAGGVMKVLYRHFCRD